MAGILRVTDSDAMSGIEPLGTVSESSAGTSPARGERTVSARSSANTEELLASTLLPLSQISDTEDSPQYDTARLMGSRTGVEQDSKTAQGNMIWKNEDGQTVSSIFSPLSEKPLFDSADKSFANNVPASQRPRDDASLPGRGERNHPSSAGQYDRKVNDSSVERGNRSLHSSLLTPRKLEKFQQHSQRSKSLTVRGESYGGDRTEEDGANSTILERRRDFAYSFNQSESRDRGGVHLAGFTGHHAHMEDGIRIPQSVDFTASNMNNSHLKQYEEQRLSADNSTLTEHLLRGISPMEDTSPYSLPFDSGLASNLQSLQAGMQSHGVSFQSESYLLQEALEKERYRRKHCELQIKELQSKLLENQQLLAVAEATRRKKDSMIAQVEKNFSKIMSDWKSKDREKLETLDRLKRDSDKHEHIARMRGQEIEVREKESRDLRMLQERLQTELHQVKDESSSHVEDMKQQMAHAIQQMEHTVEERVIAEQHVKKIQDMLAKERSQWREKEVALNKNLARMEEEFDLKQKELTSRLENEADAAQRVVAESNERKKKLSRLQDQLTKTLQEKESLSLELNLKQAQFEASLQKQEMDWKEQLERLIQERMELHHDQSNRHLEKQRAAHHVQIAEMAERHQEELKRLREESSGEMMKNDTRYQSSIDQFQSKLDLSHQEILKLSYKLEQAQIHRSTVINKLQSCLHSYRSDSLLLMGELDSSPATSTVNQRHASDTSNFAPTSKNFIGPPGAQNIRTSLEQPFLQLMASLNSDGGYQTLPSGAGGRGVPASRGEGKLPTPAPDNLSFMDRSYIASQPVESEVYNQPLPMRYEMTALGSQPSSTRFDSASLNMQPPDVRYEPASLTVQPPDMGYASLTAQSLDGRYSSTGASLPPLNGSYSSRHKETGRSSLSTSERYHSTAVVPNRSEVGLPIGFSEQTRSPQEVETSPPAGDSRKRTSKLYHFERPENDTSERSSLPQFSSVELSQMKAYEERPDEFAPVPESDDFSISEHPLDCTNQSLGDITNRLGKEEDRRNLLQHYLKELLHQTEQLGPENHQRSESTHYKSRDIHKARFSMKASRVSSMTPQASHAGYQHSAVSHSTHRQLDVPPVSAVPSNSPVQRDVIPVKERIIAPKQTSVKLGQRSSEESKSGRRSAEGSRSGRSSINSSVHLGKGHSSRAEQPSSFGTSTPKKKGQPVKPPTRKTKLVKTKSGVWR